MGEVVNLHIGQAGVQVGNACWELYCLEHGIGLDGMRDPQGDLNENEGTFFSTTESGRMVPRAIYVDYDSAAIDEVRTGTLKNLIPNDQLITGKMNSANNFAHGYYGDLGCKLWIWSPWAMDAIRKLTEACDGLQGFLIHHSLGGGTGSGTTSRIVNCLSKEYGGSYRYLRVVVSKALDGSGGLILRLPTAIVEPYNAVLANHYGSVYCDCTFLFDNDALYDMCQKNLDIERPYYPEVNEILARAIAATTASLRFKSGLNVNLHEFRTNLVPYPRLHYPLVSLAPIMTQDKANYAAPTIDEITASLFEEGSQLVKCSPTDEAFMSSCVMYRGDVTPQDVNDAITKLKETSSIRFHDSCPSGFKVGINNKADMPLTHMANTKRSACMLSNTTAMASLWSRLAHKFDLMYRKRAFVHHYTECGLDVGEFSDAREDLAALERDYVEVGAGRAPDDTGVKDTGEYHEFSWFQGIPIAGGGGRYGYWAIP